MTTLAFIRHGVTDWNKEKRAQGICDIPLNEEGKLQSQKLGRRLKAERWDFIFSSDLSRAKETAEIIAKELGMNVHGYDPRLRERSYGRLEGTTTEERIRKWGHSWETLEHGVEEALGMQKRGLEFIDEIVTRYSGSRLLVVSHGAFIGETLRSILNDDRIRGLHNTSLNIIERRQDKWLCSLLNCVKHLDCE